MAVSETVNSEVVLPSVMNLACLAATMTLLVFYVSGDSANQMIKGLIDGAVRDFSLVGSIVFPLANDASNVNPDTDAWYEVVQTNRKRYAIDAKRSEKARVKGNAALETRSWLIVAAIAATMLLPSAAYAMASGNIGALGLLVSLVVTMLLFGTEFIFYYFVVRRWIIVRRRQLYLSFCEQFLKDQDFDYPKYCATKATNDSMQYLSLSDLLKLLIQANNSAS